MEDRLKKFAKLVDAGGFTKAAQEMHISQPALSAAVAKLERELKVSLLVRGSRPLVMTPAGEVAYKTAQNLSAQTDNLKLRLNELSHQKINLKIGMIDSVADALFANGSGLRGLDNADVSMTVNNSRYLSEAVERGELDIAYTVERLGSLPAVVKSRSVASEPLVVVALDRYKIVDGKLTNFISYDQQSTTFSLVSDSLRSYGVRPHIALYSTSPNIMLQLVRSGQGVAALPYLMVQPYLQSGQLKRLGGKKPWVISRPIVALSRRDHDQPLALQKLTSQIAVEIEKLAAQV